MMLDLSCGLCHTTRPVDDTWIVTTVKVPDGIAGGPQYAGALPVNVCGNCADMPIRTLRDIVTDVIERIIAGRDTTDATVINLVDHRAGRTA